MTVCVRSWLTVFCFSYREPMHFLEDMFVPSTDTLRDKLGLNG